MIRSIDSSVADAIRDLEHGNPVLIHDSKDRENETDLVMGASDVTPKDVAFFRKTAGGLICVALSANTCNEFDMPFLNEALDHQATNHAELPYDERSSFSLPVNHREVFTGVTDKDRAHTIQKLGEAAENPRDFDFSRGFHVPGHVYTLRAAPQLLTDRMGHTELVIALAKIGDLTPAVVVCEMLDDQTGGALTTDAAKKFAQEQDLQFIDGGEIKECWAEEGA